MVKYFLFTLLPKQSNRQGRARAVDLPARSFDLERPGVAPPLPVAAAFVPFTHQLLSVSFLLLFPCDNFVLLAYRVR